MPLIKCSACEKEISTEAQSCPHCGHPQQKAGAKKSNRSGCLIIFIIFAGWLIYEAGNRNGVSVIFDQNKPETISGIISESSARPKATFEDGKLFLTYSLDPWMLTASTGKNMLYLHAKNFFSEAFSSPLVQSACIEATTTFHDIKGDENQGKAGEQCMSGNSAAGVRWDNIDTDNIPRIVDYNFIHPSFDR